MKKFIKIERIITEEQLAEIEEAINKKYRPLCVKSVLSNMGTNLCTCGEISTHQAIFDIGEGATGIEKYCQKCIDKQIHIKQPEISAVNFFEFFDTIPEYRETLRQRYEELIRSK